MLLKAVTDIKGECYLCTYCLKKTKRLLYNGTSLVISILNVIIHVNVEPHVEKIHLAFQVIRIG